MSVDEAQSHTQEVGYVIEAKRYLLSISGLPSARVNDILIDENGNRAIVEAVSEDALEALLLSDASVSPGVRFHRSPDTAQMSLGDYLFGSVVDAFGNVIGRPRETSSSSEIDARSVELAFDVVAPGVSSRAFIENQLYTGFTAVDLLVPVGKGQRELVMGPRDSGKTQFLQQAIINQKGTGVVCIYAAVGRPATFTRRLISTFAAHGALEHTVVVSALSTNPTPLITIAPATAFRIAEYFSRQGRDVLLVLDDLGIHAQYLREVALLAGRVPGRESYPGDVFYQHAHLMERAGRFNENEGGGTITLFPVIETEQEDHTSLIPTNLMASTDGHLRFSADIQSEGRVPAVSIIESVTRIGHHTQSKLQRALATRVTGIISEYPRQKEYSRFGTQLSDRTKRILTQGDLITQLLNQSRHPQLDPGTQIMLLSLVFTSLHKDDDIKSKIRKHYSDIVAALEQSDAFAALREKIQNNEEVLLDVFIEGMEKRISHVRNIWQTPTN